MKPLTKYTLVRRLTSNQFVDVVAHSFAEAKRIADYAPKRSSAPEYTKWTQLHNFPQTQL